MMTVRVRLVGLFWRWWTRERKRPPETVSRLPLRCVWTDCDINRHMNNSRYLALMDLGRYHFMLVTGLGMEVFRRRWSPVVVRIEMDYRKSLKPGERFILETRQESLGTKSVTVLQRFWKDDVLVGEARVTVLFLNGGRPVEIAPLLEKFEHLGVAAV